MDLQWQLLVTHAVGFLITLWILKRFAWGPLLAIMEERRNKIVDEFGKIEEEKENAAKLTAKYEGKLKGIESERRAKIVEAVSEGKKVAEEIKAAARDEGKAIQTRAKAELEREIAKARVQLKEEMIEITMTAAEKIIRERLDDAKHRELIGNFIDNVEKA
jgi:F-type H+-transporting ATPase subunit b